MSAFTPAEITHLGFLRSMVYFLRGRISFLRREIAAANAEGKPSDTLQKALMGHIEDFKHYRSRYAASARAAESLGRAA